MTRPALVVTALLAAALGVLGAARADAATAACSVTSQLTEAFSGTSTSPVISGDGTRVAFRSTADFTGGNTDHNMELFEVDVSSGNVNQITTSLGTNVLNRPSISDDGNRIAFSSDRDPLGTNVDENQEVFVYTVAGGTTSQRTFTNTGDSSEPAISGDGTKLAFSSTADHTGGNADGSSEIFLANASGMVLGIIQQTATGEDSFGPDINQTGSRIVFSSMANLDPTPGNGDGNVEIFVLDPAGPTISQLTDTTTVDNGDDASISDDGTRVFFVGQGDHTGGNPDENYELFRRIVTGGFTQLTDTTEGDQTQHWINASGSRAVFGSTSVDLPGNTDDNPDIYATDLAAPSAVTDTPTGDSAGSPSLTDDGMVMVFNSDHDFLGTNAGGNNELFLARCGAQTPSFSDVPTTNVFFGPIEWMAELNIASGFPNGTFLPQDPVKRQQMANFLYNLAGQPAFTPPGTPTFSDVPTSNVFYAQVEWMAAEGVASGFPDGTYHPQDAVKRQQMANFMHNFAVFVGVDV